MKEREEWRQYLNTNYWFSNIGRAKGPKGILKPYPNTSGYLQVRIYDGHGNGDKIFLSFLVATCWVDNPMGYQYVHHKDENPLNNRADNLVFVATPSHPEKRTPKRKSVNRERRTKDIAQLDTETGDIIRVWSRKKLMSSSEFYWPYIRRCCAVPSGGKHRGYRWKYITRNYYPELFDRP